MQSLLMELPLSFVLSSSEELVIDLIIIVGFFILVFGGWFIYKVTEKKLVCEECAEEIKTHDMVENCPSCGAMMKKV